MVEGQITNLVINIVPDFGDWTKQMTEFSRRETSRDTTQTCAFAVFAAS